MVNLSSPSKPSNATTRAAIESLLAEMLDGSEVDYVNEGLMKPVRPQLILPGVTDAKNWVGGKMKWVDKEQQYMLIGGHYVFGWPVYNSAFVKPASLQSWKDLLKPEFKGKVVMPNPNSSGTGFLDVTAWLQLFGEQGEQHGRRHDGHAVLEDHVSRHGGEGCRH